MYLIIVSFIIAIFVIYGVNVYYPECRVDIYYVYIGYSLCVFTFYVFVKASAADAGVIKKKNLLDLSKIYPYDNALFVESECSTCKMIK